MDLDNVITETVDGAVDAIVPTVEDVATEEEVTEVTTPNEEIAA